MQKSVGVFSWTNAALMKAVADAEAAGAHVIGYDLSKFEGYDYAEHDEVIFLQHTPEFLEGWEAKAKRAGKKMAPKVVMPKAPAAYGEKAKPAAEPAPAPVAEPSATDQSKRKPKPQSAE